MARKKRVKKVTVAELQSYITGAIEFNEDSWHPDKTQWEKIVEMIMNIKEEPPQQIIQQAPQNSQPGGRAAPPPGAAPVPPQGSNMPMEAPANGNPEFEDANRPPPERMVSGPVPQVEQVGNPGEKDPATGAFSSGKRFKTPNVDTSKGDYESGFA